jgi:ketosteroid isomerase-like protein
MFRGDNQVTRRRWLLKQFVTTSASRRSGRQRMSTFDLEQIVEEDHRATDALVRGDPEPKKNMFSQRDDVTLANPLGPPVRGWNQVKTQLERVATQLREGELIRFERISEYATPDLAYIVEIERTRMKLGGTNEMAPVSLRVTTIFRREDDGWKIVHRHADPITAPRPLASVVEQETPPA